MEGVGHGAAGRVASTVTHQHSTHECLRQVCYSTRKTLGLKLNKCSVCPDFVWRKIEFQPFKSKWKIVWQMNDKCTLRKKKTYNKAGLLTWLWWGMTMWIAFSKSRNMYTPTVIAIVRFLISVPDIFSSSCACSCACAWPSSSSCTCKPRACQFWVIRTEKRLVINVKFLPVFVTLRVSHHKSIIWLY